MKETRGYQLGSGVYNKWQQTGGEKSYLGCPIMNEAEATRSPKGTTGSYAEFGGGDGGYIIWHRTGDLARRAFEVNGCIFKLYRDRGGPGSWLGYPTGDAVATSEGSRQDFEDGYVLWTSRTGQCQSYPSGDG